MSETAGMNSAASQAGVSQDPQAAAVQAGQLLRQAREAHGLHVAALAFALKVTVEKLEALEAGRLDLLPDVVFARGLAASICRSLKVDATPVLQLLPRNAASRLGVETTAINTPFRPPGSGPSFALKGRFFSPTVIVVLALLIGALLLLLLPKMHDEEAALAPGADAAAPAPAEFASAPTDIPSPDAPAPSTLNPSSALATPAVPVLAGPVAAAPATTASAVPLAAASQAGVATAAKPNGVFVITAKSESWVRVTDAKGIVSLNRTVQAGEVVDAAGTPPLAVVVGRADAITVQVRGQPFDLAPLTKVNVARFEVK